MATDFSSAQQTNLPTTLKQKLKLSGLALVLIALWAPVLMYTQQAISGRSLLFSALPASLFIIFMPLAALAAVTFGHRLFAFTAVLLSTVYLAFFPIDLYAVPAVAVLFLGLWRAYHRAQFELHNNIRFAPQHITRHFVRVLLISFLLVVSFNVYRTVAEDLVSDDTQFYNRMAASVTKGVLPVLENQLPSFQRNESLDEYVLKGFLDANPEFNTLPAAERDALIAAYREQFLNKYGIAAQGSEALSEIAERVVASQIRELVSPYKDYLPVIYGLAIFSLLRIVSVVLALFASVWGMLVFWTARASGFIKVTTAQILAEHIEI